MIQCCRLLTPIKSLFDIFEHTTWVERLFLNFNLLSNLHQLSLTSILQPKWLCSLSSCKFQTRNSFAKSDSYITSRNNSKCHINIWELMWVPLTNLTYLTCWRTLKNWLEKGQLNDFVFYGGKDAINFFPVPEKFCVLLLSFEKEKIKIKTKDISTKSIALISLMNHTV